MGLLDAVKIKIDEEKYSWLDIITHEMLIKDLNVEFYDRASYVEDSKLFSETQRYQTKNIVELLKANQDGADALIISAVKELRKIDIS